MAKKKKSIQKGFKSNPADAKAGIKGAHIGVTSAAQRTATKKEISDFQRTGRSTAQQERLRATKRADPSSKGDVQRRVDADRKAAGFQSGDVPLRAPINPATLPQQQIQQQQLAQPQPSATFDPAGTGQIQAGQPQERESFLQRLGNTLQGETEGLNPQNLNEAFGVGQETNAKDLAQIGTAGLGIGAGAIAAAAASAGVGLTGAVSAITPAVVRGIQKVAESGANFLNRVPELLNRQAMQSANGFFSRTHVIQGGTSRIVWNTKTMSLLQGGLRAIIGNKTLVGFTALGIIGSIYGFSQNALFLRGQVSDDNTDNIGGLNFALSEAMRTGKETGDYTEALEIVDFAEQVQEQIAEQTDLMDEFNAVQAGKGNQESAIFAIANKKKQILKLQAKLEKDAKKAGEQARQEAGLE